MIERNRGLTIATHAILILGVLFVMAPVWDRDCGLHP
jgi:hypothetical protein